jgi:hypothetical protein
MVTIGGIGAAIISPDGPRGERKPLFHQRKGGGPPGVPAGAQAECTKRDASRRPPL